MNEIVSEKKRELGELLVTIQEVERKVRGLRDELTKRGDDLIGLGERLKSSPRSVAFGKPENFLSRTVPTRFIVSEDLEKFLNVEVAKNKLDQLRELEGQLKDLAQKRQGLESFLYKG